MVSGSGFIVQKRQNKSTYSTVYINHTHNAMKTVEKQLPHVPLMLSYSVIFGEYYKNNYFLFIYII